jgi:transposase
MEEAVRLREPNRKQMILKAEDLDCLIGAEHPARAIWRVLEGMELARFYAPIKAREGSAGRDATDPRMLLTLWLYGLSEGVNSAREIERRCEAHAAYRWICGGVSVNYHTLSDFRTESGAALDELMSQVLAVLMHKRLLKLYRVAQDGTRVRASAGAASFRRKRTLERCLKQARAHLAALAREAEQQNSAPTARVEAARQRAARAQAQRVEQALDQLARLGAAKARAKNHPQRKGEVRASTTDPEARVMSSGTAASRPPTICSSPPIPKAASSWAWGPPTLGSTASNSNRCRTRSNGAPKPPPNSIWPTAAI